MRENPNIPIEKLKKVKLAPALIPLDKVPPIAKQILKGAGLALLKPKLFVFDKQKIDQENATYENSAGSDSGSVGVGDGYDLKAGLFGLPIWDTITIRSPRYETFEGDIIPDTHFTFEIALLEITQPRYIIKTAIAGRNGTIKEYMSDGDYNIKLRGVLYSKVANKIPREDITKFDILMTAPVALEIESDLLNCVGVYSVVCDRYTITQREGVRNVFDIDVDFISDTPSEIEENA